MHHCESSSWRCYTAPQTCITQNGKGGSGGHWPPPKYWASQWLPLARLPHVGNNFSKREQKTEEDTLQWAETFTYSYRIVVIHTVPLCRPLTISRRHPLPSLFCFWCTTPIFSGASMWPPLWICSGRTSLFPHSNKCQPHCLKVTGSPYKLWLMQTFTEICVLFTTAWCMTTKNDLQIFYLFCEIL